MEYDSNISLVLSRILVCSFIHSFENFQKSYIRGLDTTHSKIENPFAIIGIERHIAPKISRAETRKRSESPIVI